MVIVMLIAFIIACVFIYSVVELALDHKREIEKIKRSAYVCRKCGENTPVVIHTNPLDKIKF